MTNALMRGLFGGQQGNQSADFTGKRDFLGRPVYENTLKSPLLANDPFVQQMNAKYKYIAPDSQVNAFGDGGAGFDFTKNKYGSWDLGNGNVLAPKWNFGTGSNVDPFFTTRNDFSNTDHYKPLNADGTIDPSQWAVRSTKSQAMGGIMGTLGVLGAAAGASFWGPSASQTANSALSNGLNMASSPGVTNNSGNALSSSLTGSTLTGSTPIAARHSSGGRGIR